jgi:hypothetical protein
MYHGRGDSLVRSNTAEIGPEGRIFQVLREDLEEILSWGAMSQERWVSYMLK